MQELEQHWSLDGLVKAHMALDVEDELAAEAEAQAEQRQKNGRSP